MSVEFRFYKEQLDTALSHRRDTAERLAEIDHAIEIVQSRNDESLNLVLAALKAARDIEDRFSQAQIQYPKLIAEIDRAKAAYREGNRAKAAQVMNWTAGKKSRTLPVASIVATYFLKLGFGYTPSQAIDNLMAIYPCLHSREALIKLLAREKKRSRLIPLPPNWPKVHPRNKRPKAFIPVISRRQFPPLTK